jgi:phosphoribosylamine---glycine ligase
VMQSPLTSKLIAVPGNAGMGQHPDYAAIKATDFEGMKRVVLAEKIDFVIVGPDDPLALGIVDFFQNDDALKNILILGPEAKAARLESSKDFAKGFMMRHKIPTAAYRTFIYEERSEAASYIYHHSLPVVIKADGLAAGKGVAVCATHSEALGFLSEIWEHWKFGASGDKIVVEEFLDGIELSAFILTDGVQYVLLPVAKDYKRIGEGDTGANTGGMGSVSPVPFADATFMQKVRERIIDPTVKGLRDENIPYRGFIFFGLINVKGDPFVIEYNARMGDPETQVVFPRIKSDILPQMIQVAKGNLEDTSIEISPDFAAAIIVVSNGYPEAYETGKIISGIEKVEDCKVFHAGTKDNATHDHLITSGGRVLAVTAMAGTLEEALEKAYDNIQKIHFDGMSYRTDIGKDLA